MQAVSKLWTENNLPTESGEHQPPPADSSLHDLASMQKLSDKTRVGGIPWSELKHKRIDSNWDKNSFLNGINADEKLLLDVLWRAQQIQGDMDQLNRKTLKSEDFVSYL